VQYERQPLTGLKRAQDDLEGGAHLVAEQRRVLGAERRTADLAPAGGRLRKLGAHFLPPGAA